MRVLIFANGDPVPREVVQQWLQPGALIVAADGGARLALAAGLTPDVLIGDFDSLPDELRADLAGRTRLIAYPARKDETDLELAIGHALAQGGTELIIFGALGGRWDQSLANILLLTLPALRDVPACIVDQHQTLRIIRDGAEAHIDGRVGDRLSLIALGGDARGVTIHGCEYPLHDAELPFGKTLGISNVLAEPAARVRVKEGVVLAIHIRQP